MAVTKSQTKVWVADNIDFSFPQFVGKEWQLLSLTNLSRTGQCIIPQDSGNSPPSSERNRYTAGLPNSLTFLSFPLFQQQISYYLKWIQHQLLLSSFTFPCFPAKAFPPHSLQLKQLPTHNSIFKGARNRGGVKGDRKKRCLQKSSLKSIWAVLHLLSIPAVFYPKCLT